MLDTPFPPWPAYTEEETNAVRDVISSNRVNYWTGQECRLFEQEFSRWAETEYAVALANGTFALDIALKALDLECGDEVIVTPRTFLASASSIVTAGAVPIFADVDPDSQNITAETIAAVLSPRTKAIICVHLAGWPCDMDPIMELASRHGLAVIEDCAQAHGARYKGRPVGSIGHIGAWSFCQDKIMTTGGEGGMVTTNDRTLWQRMWSYKDHGKSWEATYGRKHEPGFRWLHESFGTNGRMMEVQAAIGRIQLRRMDAWHESRLANAERIWQAARAAGLRAPHVPAHITHAAYKCYVFMPDTLGAETRDRTLQAINAQGVPCYAGSCSEVYLEKAFDNTGWRPEKRLPAAKALGERALMFLVHPGLQDAHIEKTCRVIHNVMTRMHSPLECTL